MESGKFLPGTIVRQFKRGSGKSTLLEAVAIAYGFNPEGGTLNYRFSTYDSHSELSDAIRLAKGVQKHKWGYFLRAESYFRGSRMPILSALMMKGCAG